MIAIGHIETVGILDADDLAKAKPGAVAGIALWSLDMAEVAGPAVQSPDHLIVFTSLESLRGLTLALIRVCGELGIHPNGMH